MNEKHRKAMYAKFRELNHNAPSEWKSEKEYRQYADSVEGKKEINEINKQYLKILYDRQSQGQSNQAMIDHVKKSIT